MAASEPTRATPEQKPRSLFDLPPDFFDSCRLLFSCSVPSRPPPPSSELSHGDSEDDGFDQKKPPIIGEIELKGIESREQDSAPRWTCNICKSEFVSLQEQRSHFKSDVHRLNVKLNIAGKNIIKEEDLDEVDIAVEDFDVSSISGSEDEFEKVSSSNSGISGKGRGAAKQKLHLRLHSGEVVSIWRSLILNESEDLMLENHNNNFVGDSGCFSYVEEAELVSRLKLLVCEPRNKTHLRILLLVSGGHFAGCVFDGNSVVAHKTFHRYVVRAKAGKKQSSKDATGKSANSAGSSLRRHNEAALKKEIQELLILWKPYIDSSSCVFVYAPGKNRQMLFDVEKPQFGLRDHLVRHIPMTVRRPTLKEAKRVYGHLTLTTYEVEVESVLGKVSLSCAVDVGTSNQKPIEKQLGESLVIKESSSLQSSSIKCLPSVGESTSLASSEYITTPLHEAVKAGDAQRTLELLEQDLDPCIKDERGRTPYMLAADKEVRNTFRRFMALNLDKWDWHAANVPSPLTKELEESQAAKQAEKDAKRKAKAKELKKLRKEKEKAKAAQSQNTTSSAPQGQVNISITTAKQQPRSNGGVIISKEEEQRRALAEEREKRAAAAERRIAALNAHSEPKGGTSNAICSCCNASLAGKIPFHRYNYKYCSTTCMHVHREMLEDGG